MQKQQKRLEKRCEYRFSMRWVIFVIAGFSIITGSIIWIANGDNGGGRWAGIISIIFVAVGILISLLQWLFPISVDMNEGANFPSLHISSMLAGQDVPVLTQQLADRLFCTSGASTYRGILGLPPPTDGRTIQQRTSMVREIYVKLISSEVTALALIGIGGVGKSTLAALVYKHAEERYRTHEGPFSMEPLWLTIDKSVTMVDLIGTLFHASGKPLPNLETLAPQNQAMAFFHLLKEMSETRLIVLDQFENFLDWQTGQALTDRPGIGELLDAMNSQSCRSKILLTSRLRPQGTRVYPATFMRMYPVTGFNIAEGIELLRRQGIDAGMATDTALRLAVMQCEGHALAMTLLASLLCRNRGVKLPHLLDDAIYAQLWRGDIARNLLDYIYKQQLGLLHRQLLRAFAIYRQAVPLEAALALFVFDSKVSKQAIIFTLDTLVTQNLLQYADRNRYQSHAIITGYIKEHFSEDHEETDQTLPTGHARAALYYLQLAATSCPARAMRKYISDVQPLIEAIWHFCQAQQWQDAYHVTVQENLYDDLRRWGGNTILMELYQLLLPLDRWHPERSQKAAIYSNLGRIHSTLGHKGQAIHYYEEALRIYREIGDQQAEAGALNHLGSVYENLGHYERARTYHQQALSICRDIGDAKGEGDSVNGLAWIYHHRGQKEEALEHYKQALHIRRSTENFVGEGDTLNGLGLIYHALGKQDLALECIEQSLLIRHNEKDRGGEGRTLNHLGLICADTGQLERAYTCYKASLDIRKEVGDRNGEGVSLYNIGKLYFQHHHDKTSLACFLLARNIFEEVQSTSHDAAQRWIKIVQDRVGEEQFPALLAEVEPRVFQIAEQALLNAL